ncbi:Histone-lysine N-methyltransferase SETMAR [Eumeta japonica]|uniref:Histone-lysine N-methyltransferase SETMAR n=1 Tax=Eumeta variegata TaxID=151549 RepID=A0A4C1VX13_EUMVA|nr:Histone-lysine N-methyltransferase SETMAR [Eumeta japonica]
MKHGYIVTCLKTKQQSSVWVFEGNSKPTKLRRARSVGKKMIAFFSPRRILSARSLLKNKRHLMPSGTPPFVCSVGILEKIREKRLKSRILLHHDYASPHTANKTMSFSPDLAPCDFFIFPKIKDLMRGLTFTGPEEAELAFDQQRVKKCIKCNGEYFITVNILFYM